MTEMMELSINYIQVFKGRHEDSEEENESLKNKPN